MNNKKVVLVDLDDVLCNFTKAFKEKYTPEIQYPQSQYGFFTKLEPIKDAIPSFKLLKQYFDVCILTRPSIPNPFCYLEKRIWVEEFLGYEDCEELMLVPRKRRVIGDFLIDDNIHEGFIGEHLHFGEGKKFPDWNSIIDYLITNKRY